MDTPSELHVWRAQLGLDSGRGADNLPPTEQVRATKIQRPSARRRWVAARWALRDVLGRYLERDPAEIELRFGSHGKPMLAAQNLPLHFNLSHSGELALIAISGKHEVGVDVQAIGAKPPEFYAEWTQREAIAKCHGTGLWAPLPDADVAVAALDPGAGYAGAIAVSGTEMPPLRHFDVEPG